MRLICCAAAVVCALLFGVELCSRIKTRVRLLEDICIFSREAMTAVQYRRLPPEQLAAENADSRAEFLRLCAQHVAGGEGFRGAWEAAIAESTETNLLIPEEKRALIELGTGMGRSDTDGEVKRLEAALHRFTQLYEQARSELTAKSKLYLSCSVLCGMAVVILIV
ncbi:MAG: hypothetical protein E7559_02900 [Ruminococcaceae bacterium]|nr:hypothetical protein [Oscillospiraceae bacterium]